MRVAIVHDWLLGMRGGERCLEVILDFFPDADIYTLFYDPDGVSDRIKQHRVVASSLNKLPAVHSYYRNLLALYAVGIRDIERKIAAEGYDTVVSISHCAAKNLRLPKGVFHLCYCLTPVRYLWDQYDSYFGGRRIEPLIRPIAALLRRWDQSTAAGVSHFAGISQFVADRIARYYHRDADVVYPPVRTDWIKAREPGEAGEGFLCVNALVPYKNTALVVAAFNELRLPLLVVGSGPEEAALKSLAGPTISFRSGVSDEELAEIYRRSKALVFAAEEDFGMVPVEVQAAGRPIICYGRGGSRETVLGEGPSRTGIFFSELSTAAIAAAVKDFLANESSFTTEACRRQAENFSLERFHTDFSALLNRCGLADKGAARRDAVAATRHG